MAATRHEYHEFDTIAPRVLAEYSIQCYRADGMCAAVGILKQEHRATARVVPVVVVVVVVVDVVVIVVVGLVRFLTVRHAVA